MHVEYCMFTFRKSRNFIIFLNMTCFGFTVASFIPPRPPPKMPKPTRYIFMVIDVTMNRICEISQFLDWQSKFRVNICGSVHRDIIYENDQQDATVQDNLLFLSCFTRFERYYRSSSGATKLYLQLLVLHTYVVAGCRQQHTHVILEVVNTVLMLLMMSENIPRNMQSSQGKINYSIQLHLVGHFRILQLQV